jgi:putative spermidine/putrescine transport system ATP-binding protein
VTPTDAHTSESVAAGAAIPSAPAAGGGDGPRGAALELRSVGKTFGATVALADADLDVAPGEFLTLLGPSGSGKTTLLRLIVGFETPTSGQILLRDRDISRMSPAERDIGMVFQQYALFPHMTVADNIAYGLKIRRWSAEKRSKRVAEMLELLRLDSYGERYPRQLSGGQQQRVALGRALAYDPALILMDEPLGALDRTLRLEMEEEIRRIHRDLEATVIYVTHDQQEALALSDRIAIMRAGRITALDTPEELYYRPANSFVASFFANANLLPIEGFDLTSDGLARVRCAGQELDALPSGAIDGPALLSVRPRSLRLRPTPGLELRGVVQETLLFGDEREVAVQTEHSGRISAVLDARDSVAIKVGDSIALHVPAGEAVLVPELPDA